MFRLRSARFVEPLDRRFRHFTLETLDSSIHHTTAHRVHSQSVTDNILRTRMQNCVCHATLELTVSVVSHHAVQTQHSSSHDACSALCPPRCTQDITELPTVVALLPVITSRACQGRKPTYVPTGPDDDFSLALRATSLSLHTELCKSDDFQTQKYSMSRNS